MISPLLSASISNTNPYSESGRELRRLPVLLLFPIYVFLYLMMLCIPLISLLKGLMGTVSIFSIYDEIFIRGIRIDLIHMVKPIFIFYNFCLLKVSNDSVSE